jgi:hypothetical protein
MSSPAEFAAPEPVQAQRVPCPEPEAGRRCPRGCRRNKKDKKCYPVRTADVRASETAPSDDPCPDPGPGKRCPRGCRRSRKDGKCRPTRVAGLDPRRKGRESRFGVKPGVVVAAAPAAYPYLYPTLDSPDFNAQLVRRKEFYDTRYEGGVRDVIAEAERLCNAEFELAPHQLFVRNFLSLQTPYNGMLLYHGLGSGKTCSAIGVAEEMRDYLRQTGAGQGKDKIIIVAAPNVQENFKVQLFDPSRLEESPKGSGLWSIRSCTGGKYLREVNPLATAKLSKDKVVREVRRLIRASYKFYGYEKFANLVTRMLEGTEGDSPAARRKARALDAWAQNRLIIVDEVHNISTFDTKDKAVSEAMERLVGAVPKLRLLLLSATPMYHDPKEIVWLLNLLRVNDGQSEIRSRDLFRPDGSFRAPSEEDGGRLVGRELLQSRATGYVSFVRGENPYTFPYRIWPSVFAPDRTFAATAPARIQLNGEPVRQPLQHLQVYLVRPTGFQAVAYDYIVNTIDTSSLQYTTLQVPIQALDMVYPVTGAETLELLERTELAPAELVAARGLARTMDYEESGGGTNRTFSLATFAYKPGVPRVFAQENIGDYSAKIASVVDAAVRADGVVLIHTEYIPGGVVPVALALEERGFTRAGTRRSLFRVAPAPPLDYRPAGTPEGDAFAPASYAVITGDQGISPDNAAELRLVTAKDNVDGRKAKVVIISQAGAEGLDLRFVRQVHVLEPWYNMSRIEQIIGRAVRTCSHRDLPFPMRNVQIFLYASVLAGSEREAADVYVYRQAEARAVRIGRVARALKESAVDCLLNLEQMGFTVEQMNQTVPQTLADGQEIRYAVGDRPHSAACDYLDSCAYKCRPVATLEGAVGPDGPVLDTFSEAALVLNAEKVMQRIRLVFRDRYFVSKARLVALVTAQRAYPLAQIDAALSQLVDDRSERLTDKYGRAGRLVNVANMYYFQPLELGDTALTVAERATPLAFKREAIKLSVAPAPERRRSSAQSQTDAATLGILEDIEAQYAAARIEQGPEGRARGDVMAQAVVRLRTQGLAVKDIGRLVAAYLADRVEAERLPGLLDALDAAKEPTPLVEHLRAHFAGTTMRAGTLEAVPAFSLDEGVEGFRLVVKRPGKLWAEAEAEDSEDFGPALEALRASFTPHSARLGSPLGFLYPFKRKELAFKVKDMYQAGKPGARCDQGGMTDAKRKLAALVAEHGFDIGARASRPLTCALQELVLRHFTNEALDSRAWFFSAPMAILLELPKLHFGN